MPGSRLHARCAQVILGGRNDLFVPTHPSEGSFDLSRSPLFLQPSDDLVDRYARKTEAVVMPSIERAPPRDAGSDNTLAERERLVEHQLRHYYDEVLQLRKERFEVVYTATWLVVRPLLRAEEALGRFARRLFGRIGA